MLEYRARISDNNSNRASPHILNDILKVPKKISMSQNRKTATYLFFFRKSHPLIPGLTLTYLFSPSVNPVQLPAFLLNLLKLRTWNQCVYHVHTHSVHGVHTHCEPSASAADESRSAPFAFRHFSILHTCVYKLNLKHIFESPRHT